jgi:hypothetical protein
MASFSATGRKTLPKDEAPKLSRDTFIPAFPKRLYFIKSTTPRKSGETKDQSAVNQSPLRAKLVLAPVQKRMKEGLHIGSTIFAREHKLFALIRQQRSSRRRYSLIF